MAVTLSEASFVSKSQLDLIYSVLEDLKLKGKEVTIVPLAEAGGNFMADVRFIKVKDENENKEFKIVMKLSPSSRQNTIGAVTTAVFTNEILMYAEILPTLSELQEKAGVELKNAFQFATCYGFYGEKQQEIILLEDLLQYGYTTLDKFKPLSSETIKLVLTSLADYHSMSYALKDKSPDKFNEFAKKLVNMNSVMGPEELMVYSKIGEELSQIFDKEKYKKFVKNLYTVESMQKSDKLNVMDAGSKYSVIVHGDTWTNNILFKVDGDKTTDCIFIDYQLVRESMPVVDVLYLIFNCTDYETRSRHFEEWLSHYHAQLEKSLFNFGLRVNNVYPRDKLDSDLRRYVKQVVTVVIMTLSVLLRKNEEATNFKDGLNNQDINKMVEMMQISSLQMETVMKVKERIEGVIDSCFELGLVNAV